MFTHVEDDTLGRFIRLFSGRIDCYGSWEGGCIRQAVTDETFRNHLSGQGPFIGIYPITPSGNVRWGCVDIDEDNPRLATTVAEAADVLDLRMWTERTRKGWHVWLFADKWVPARVMRRALLVVCQVANYDPKEVNPKQEHLSDTQVGNYVRLPYPCGFEATERRIESHGHVWPLDQFVESAVVTAVTEQRLEAVAAMWQPPKAAPPPETIIGGRWNPNGLFDRLRMAIEGERNNVLFWCCAKVVDDFQQGQAASQEAVDALLVMRSIAVSALGLTEREADRTIHSAAKGVLL